MMNDVTFEKLFNSTLVFLFLNFTISSVLPRRFLYWELARRDVLKQYRAYEKKYIQLQLSIQRIRFLESCVSLRLIPRFLKFRVPANGCFNESTVLSFQRKLLQQELKKAKDDQKRVEVELKRRRDAVKFDVPKKLHPSLWFHLKEVCKKRVQEAKARHQRKIENVSAMQDKPLLNTTGYLTILDDIKVPDYVRELLRYGPKHPCRTSFQEEQFLANIDLLLERASKEKLHQDALNKINALTVGYVMNCKYKKPDKNIKSTRQWLKDQGILAVPYDKGTGFCLMKAETYNHKVKKLLEGPQFVPLAPKKKDLTLTEEDRVCNVLKTLQSDGKIDKELFQAVKPIGSQPARFYGLAKVHKKDIPLRPIVSMPGSAYHPLAKQLAKWISKLPEASISCNVGQVMRQLSDIQLQSDEQLVSLDVEGLFTNVPVNEAIAYTTELMYSPNHDFAPPIDQDTFAKLLKLVCVDVVFSTHQGYFKQVDGVAMGSPLGPLLANVFMSKFDKDLGLFSPFYYRYVDDILRTMLKGGEEYLLNFVNTMHPNLKFTLESEDNEGGLSFLDMRVEHVGNKIEASWYTKKTDTGVVLNYNSEAPNIFKSGIVSGFVHRIFNISALAGMLL